MTGDSLLPPLKPRKEIKRLEEELNKQNRKKDIESSERPGNVRKKYQKMELAGETSWDSLTEQLENTETSIDEVNYDENGERRWREIEAGVVDCLEWFFFPEEAEAVHEVEQRCDGEIAFDEEFLVSGYETVDADVPVENDSATAPFMKYAVVGVGMNPELVDEPRDYTLTVIRHHPQHKLDSYRTGADTGASPSETATYQTGP